MESPFGTKKRILVFVPEFPRLTETFIQREISKLIDLGNLDVTVFSINKASGKLYENVSNHVTYQRLKFSRLIIAWIYFFARKPNDLWVAYKFFLNSAEGGVLNKTLFFIKSVGYVYLFSLHSPDHIHANFMSWPSTMAMLASKILRIPYSISAHAKDVMVEGEHFSAKVRTAKFISICNRFAYEDCIKRSGKDNPKNVLLQYHGIDSVQAFDSIKPVKRSERLFLFNGGARLVEKKGQKYLIEAAKILKDKSVDFELHIAGPGPLYEDLKMQIQELDLQECVFIHGEGEGVSFNEVVSYLKACDIVVQSNINLDSGDADGIPTFIIEAAMLGKPIVATDAGSIKELIVNKETGLIVNQKNPQELADAILTLTQGMNVSFGDAAKKKAMEMFDIDKNIKELEQLLIQ